VLEELEQRAVPAVLTGRHAINSMFTGNLTNVQSLLGSLGSGSGQVGADLTIGSGIFKGATVSFAGSLSPHLPSLTLFDASGTLTITTKHGSVNTTGNMGSVDITNLSTMHSGTFNDSGTISGGTGQFKGVSGNFTISGTFDAISQSATGTITGTIMGGKAHHGKHHK
jgi:hypothetical protein